MKIDEIDSGSRLDAMAREHGLTRWVGGILIATQFACLGWIGLPSRPAVRAERLELRDRQGRLRAELALDRDEGIPRLRMFDADGRAQVSLIASRAVPFLEIQGAGGSLIHLAPGTLGYPAMSFVGPGGRGSASVQSDADGSIGIAAESGGLVAKWNLRPDERGRLRLGDPSPIGGPPPVGWSRPPDSAGETRLPGARAAVDSP